MSGGSYQFNNPSKALSIHAHIVKARPNEELKLQSAENMNMRLDSNGGEVRIQNNMKIRSDGVTFESGTILANHMSTTSSQVKIPITYNNFSFADPSQMNTNKTTIANTWQNLKDDNYKVEFSPRSIRSKMYIKLKINYAASNESSQLITFGLYRSINNGAETELFIDASMGTLMGVANNAVYSADYIDSPNTTDSVCYYIKYRIEGNDIDIPSGVIGSNDSNINFIMAQELYIPPTDVNETAEDGTIQSVTDYLLSGQDAVMGDVVINGTLSLGGADKLLIAPKVDMGGSQGSNNTGDINNTRIGATERASGFFTSLQANGFFETTAGARISGDLDMRGNITMLSGKLLTVSDVDIGGGSIDNTVIGGNVTAHGYFNQMHASENGSFGQALTVGHALSCGHAMSVGHGLTVGHGTTLHSSLYVGSTLDLRGHLYMNRGDGTIYHLYRMDGRNSHILVNGRLSFEQSSENYSNYEQRITGGIEMHGSTFQLGWQDASGVITSKLTGTLTEVDMNTLGRSSKILMHGSDAKIGYTKDDVENPVDKISSQYITTVDAFTAGANASLDPCGNTIYSDRFFDISDNVVFTAKNIFDFASIPQFDVCGNQLTPNNHFDIKNDVAVTANNVLKFGSMLQFDVCGNSIAPNKYLDIFNNVQVSAETILQFGDTSDVGGNYKHLDICNNVNVVAENIFEFGNRSTKKFRYWGVAQYSSGPYPLGWDGMDSDGIANYAHIYIKLFDASGNLLNVDNKYYAPWPQTPEEPGDPDLSPENFNYISHHNVFQEFEDTSVFDASTIAQYTVGSYNSGAKLAIQTYIDNHLIADCVWMNPPTWQDNNWPLHYVDLLTPKEVSTVYNQSWIKYNMGDPVIVVSNDRVNWSILDKTYSNRTGYMGSPWHATDENGYRKEHRAPQTWHRMEIGAAQAITKSLTDESYKYIDVCSNVLVDFGSNTVQNIENLHSENIKDVSALYVNNIYNNNNNGSYSNGNICIKDNWNAENVTCTDLGTVQTASFDMIDISVSTIYNISNTIATINDATINSATINSGSIDNVTLTNSTLTSTTINQSIIGSTTPADSFFSNIALSDLDANGNIIGSNPELHVPEFITSQVGNAILHDETAKEHHGEYYPDKRTGGFAISMSKDGSLMAVGDPKTNNVERGAAGWNEVQFSGRVRVFSINNGVISQMGSTIFPEDVSGAYNYFGWSVSIVKAPDGIYLAASTPGYDENRGRGRVYKFENNDWSPLGANPLPEFGWNTRDPDWNFGKNMNLFYDTSYNRLTVLTSMDHDGTSGTDANYVIWSWQGNYWLKRTDASIPIEGGEKTMRTAIAQGYKAIIGMPDATVGGTGRKGFVRVFGDGDGQIGSDIVGYGGNDRFGATVAINLTGTIIAVGNGAPAWTGGSSVHNGYYDATRSYVRVFELSNNSWIQLGSDIEDSNVVFSEGSIALNDAGDIIAIGYPGENNRKGKVRMYQYTSGSWSLIKQFDGTGEEGMMGEALALNNDGTRIVISEPGTSLRMNHELRHFSHSNHTESISVYDAAYSEPPEVRLISGTNFKISSISCEFPIISKAELNTSIFMHGDGVKLGYDVSNSADPVNLIRASTIEIDTTATIFSIQNPDGSLTLSGPRFLKVDGYYELTKAGLANIKFINYENDVVSDFGSSTIRDVGSFTGTNVNVDTLLNVTGSQNITGLLTATGGIDCSDGIFTSRVHSDFDSTLTVDGLVKANSDIELTTGNLVLTSGQIHGPATLVIDPAAIGDDTGKVTIKGDLEIQGTQTTVNSTTVELNNNRMKLNAETAVDAGLEIEFGDSSTASFLYENSTDSWKTGNKHLSIGSGNLLSQNITANGTLTVHEETDLQKTVTIGGLLAVYGGIVGNNGFSVGDTNGNISTTGTLSVADSVDLGSSVTIHGLMSAYTGTIGSTLTVTGNVNMNSSATIDGTATIGSTLTCNGHVDMNSSVTIDGLLTAYGGIVSDNGFSVANSSGNISTNGTLYIASTGTIGSTLTVNGHVDMNSSVTIDGTLTAHGGIVSDNGFTVENSNGNISTNGTLTVNGHTDLNSSVTIDGLLTAYGGIVSDNGFSVGNSNGNISTNGTLNIGSTGTIGNTLTCNGHVDMNSSATIDGLLTAYGGIVSDNGFSVGNGNGNISTNGTLYIASTATINSTLTCNGHVDMNSTATIDGILKVNEIRHTSGQSDKNIVIGMARIGGAAANLNDNSAYFGTSDSIHNNNYSSYPTEYAIKQKPSNDTWINAINGQKLHLCINNSSMLSYDGSTLDMNQRTITNVSSITSTEFNGYLNGNISGNAGGNANTATQLQSTRTIAGSSFNGSSDIDINYNNLQNKPTHLSQFTNNINISATTITGTINNDILPVLQTSKIPSLDAVKISSGTFDIGRIPALDWSRISAAVEANVSTGTISTSAGSIIGDSNNTINIGFNAGAIPGQYNEKSINIGYDAGSSGSGMSSIAIGDSAARDGQDHNSIAIGYYAAETSQGHASLAIGYEAGKTNQKDYAVAVGKHAGSINQSRGNTAIGSSAGYQNQGGGSTAIGGGAGAYDQGGESTAIGGGAGNYLQGIKSIAIGVESGKREQGDHAVSVGQKAGYESQKIGSIAIGYLAGYNYLGENSIAIGKQAGEFSLPNNNIMLNATGNTLGSNVNDALFMKPIRNSNNSQYLLYDVASGEVTYGTNTSDDRLKHNEIDITNGLEIIRQLKPQFYKKTRTIYQTDMSGDEIVPRKDINGNIMFYGVNYKGDIGRENVNWDYDAGLIAQDLLKIPELSFAVRDGNVHYDNSNNLIQIDPMGVNYENIFTYNISATKELDTIVQQQKSTIEQQQIMINSLISRIEALEAK